MDFEKIKREETMKLSEVLKNIKHYIRVKEPERRLRKGQHGIFMSLHEFLKKGMTMGYLMLPSGLGKTNIAIELAIAGGFKKVLFLVPTITLVDQIEERFRKFSNFTIDVFTGARKNMSEQITVATYQSIQRQHLLPEKFDLVIFDEVHEALSPGRQNIRRHFGPETIQIGLTASDVYNETKRVSCYLPLIAKMTIEEAIKLGMLCHVQSWLAQTNIDISKITRRMGDYDPKAQKRYIDVSRRNKSALDIYKRFLRGQTCLITCINVSHAIKVARIFQRAGIASKAVWGSNQRRRLTKMDLKQRLADFKTGKIQVLTTVDLVDRGFDNTLITALINLRITSSVVKATQRGGRVLRLFSKDDKKRPIAQKMMEKFHGKLATVVDFLDECHNHTFRPVLFSDILGQTYQLPPEMEYYTVKRMQKKELDLWPSGGQIRIELFTNVTQIAKITSRLTTYENLPVSNKDEMLFLPVKH
ncbi:MAG: DEAD/DEAH box helicase family protein [Patescibacteria group bacterium]|nr:DEAD/DEAH box helicase family protein [Patescibacteria group bacterium]